jgi:protein TonB
MTEKTPAQTPRVGGLIREPRLIEGKAPEYPPIAQVAGLSADVILEAHVGRDGRILSAEIVKGHPLFDDAAVASVRSRRYEPLLLNGVPSDFLVTITVSFRIRR